MILTFQYSSVLILHHFTFRQARNNFSEDSFIQCTYFLYSSLSHPLLQVEPLYRIYIQIRTINECIFLNAKNVPSSLTATFSPDRSTNTLNIRSGMFKHPCFTSKSEGTWSLDVGKLASRISPSSFFNTRKNLSCDSAPFLNKKGRKTTNYLLQT